MQNLNKTGTFVKGYVYSRKVKPLLSSSEIFFELVLRDNLILFFLNMKYQKMFYKLAFLNTCTISYCITGDIFENICTTFKVHRLIRVNFMLCIRIEKIRKTST